MSVIKSLAGYAFDFLPDNANRLKRTMRNAQVRKQILVGKARRLLSKTSLPDPRTIYWIDPKRIESHSNVTDGSGDWEDWVFQQSAADKLVRSGSWDLATHKVSDMRIVRAVDERIHQSAKWESTDYFRTALRQIESGQSLWGCSDRIALARHCEEIDRLIDSVRTSGYLLQPDDGSSVKIDTSLGHTQVLVNIARNGAPLFQDGRHRLAVAVALGIETIPVQILVRHAEWQAFREYMHGMARGQGGASSKPVLYQSPVHFDLGDIPYAHGCEDRWKAIQSRLPDTQGTALDIGSNLGYFCHELQDEGFHPIGVEYMPDIVYAARKIAESERREIEFISGDILSPNMIHQMGTSQFSVVLALNIFHHFIKTREGYERLGKFLESIDVEKMFFESHDSNEPQMEGAYYNPVPEEFSEKIKSWGSFSKMEPIYSTAQDGRTVFLLEK